MKGLACDHCGITAYPLGGERESIARALDKIREAIEAAHTACRALPGQGREAENARFHLSQAGRSLSAAFDAARFNL